MSFLDSVRSGGGGSIEGKVTDVEFVRGWPLGPGGVWIDDEDDRQNTENINFVLRILPDGAEEPVTKVMYLGSGDYLVIGEEGKVLQAGEDGDVDEDRAPTLFADGAAGRFIVSLDEAGFDVNGRFPDPEESKTLDFRALINERLRIADEKDEEATKQFGKRKGKGKAKGKEYNRTWLKVVKHLGTAEPVKGKAAKATSKPTKGKEAPVEDDDIPFDSAAADKLITAVIESEGGKVNRDKIRLSITRYLTKKKLNQADYAELSKLVSTEEYLVSAAERDVVAFNVKKQTVELAA